VNDGVVKLRMFSESRGYGTIWLDPDGLIKISYFWVTFSSSDSNQFNVHTSNGGSTLGVLLLSTPQEHIIWTCIRLLSHYEAREVQVRSRSFFNHMLFEYLIVELNRF